MAVISQLTTVEDFEASPIYSSIGGGAGASSNTDVYIQGSTSGARRADNTTDFGFYISVTAIDMSAAGEHVKFWLFITHWPQTTQVQLRLGDGTNDDDHELPTTEYPPLGGFIPVWIDVSRTPEIGGSANEASLADFGVLVDIGNVGGNAPNLILDEILYGTSGLLWSGTGGDFTDFTAFEGTNNEGNVIELNGVLFVYSRLEIGDSSATGFTDNGKTLIFPDQALVAPTFMGITVDLQHASTDIDIDNCNIQSSNPLAATNRPDFLVTGTSGAFDTNGTNFTGMRLIQLTSACTIDGGTLDTQDLTQASAEIKNATIKPRTASQVAMCDDPTFGTPSGIHDCAIIQAGSGHAFEITSTGTVTLTNLTYSGFGANGANDAVFYNNSGGEVTLQVSGGGTPTYRNGTGATTNVINTKTVKVTVQDLERNNIENAHVFIEADSGGDLPAAESVTITRSGSTATVSHTAHGMKTNDKAAIRDADQQEYNSVFTITKIDDNSYSYTVSGTPATPATGTITATAVTLNALTNSSGIAQNTGFSYTSDQPVVGWVRKSSSSPYYKHTPIIGTIDNNGFSLDVVLVLDE